MMRKLKNFKNKKFAIMLVCVLILSFCLPNIIAYLADGMQVNNSFVIGGNRITIEEEFTPAPELKPGVSFTKNVSVKNTGPTTCFVRIMAVFTTSDMEKYCEVDWNDAANGGAWILNTEDGYWYYPTAIATGEETPSLFTNVKIKEKYDFDGNGTLDEDETIPQSVINDFDIIVYAESYQSTEFSNYQDAWAHYQMNKPD